MRNISSAIAFAGVFLLSSLTSCGGSDRYQPPDAIISSSLNALGDHQAIVLWRHGSTDAIMVYVTKAPNAVPTAQMGQDRIAFVATGTAGVIRVVWTGLRTLDIVCDYCSLPLDSADRSLDRVGSIAITYRGFPSVHAELFLNLADNPSAKVRAALVRAVVPGSAISDYEEVTLKTVADNSAGNVQEGQGEVLTNVGKVIFEIRKCRPLRTEWSSNSELVIVCDGCGRSLEDATTKVDSYAGIRIRYRGFGE